MESDVKPASPPTLALTDEEVGAGVALLTILVAAGLSEAPTVQYTSTTLRAEALGLTVLSHTARIFGEYESAFEGAAIGAVVTTYTLGGPTWFTVADAFVGLAVRRLSRVASAIEATRVRVEEKLRRRNAEVSFRRALNLGTVLVVLLLLAAIASAAKQ
jgi:hypothetical protein